MTTLDDQRIGDSIYRVLYDAPSVPEVCYQLAMEPFFIALMAVINVALLQYSYGEVAPELVWIAWSAFPLALIITLPASALVRRTSQAKRSAGAATTNAMEETMDNIYAVQSLGGLAREVKRFAERSEESFLPERFALAVVITLVVLGLAVVVVLGLYVTVLVSDKIIDGEMTPGDFLTLFGIFLEIVFTAVGAGALRSSTPRSDCSPYWKGLPGAASRSRSVTARNPIRNPECLFLRPTRSPSWTRRPSLANVKPHYSGTAALSILPKLQPDELDVRHRHIKGSSLQRRVVECHGGPAV